MAVETKDQASIPDERLVTLLRQGYRYALALAHDEADADDLLQDAWVRLHDRGKSQDTAYFLRIIRNLFIDRTRQRRLVPLTGQAADPNEPDAVDDSPLAVDRDSLQQALGELRVEERECLYLQAVEGYTAQEIADLSGQSRGTVLSLIHRAKNKMRRLLSAAAVEVSS